MERWLLTSSGPAAFPRARDLIVSGATTVPAIVAIWASRRPCRRRGSGRHPHPTAGVTRSSLVAFHRDLVPALLAGSLVELGGQTATTFAIGLVAGLATVGTLRAGQLVLSPLFVLFQGVTLVAPPEAARLLRASPLVMQRLLLFLGSAWRSSSLPGGRWR